MTLGNAEMSVIFLSADSVSPLEDVCCDGLHRSNEQLDDEGALGAGRDGGAPGRLGFMEKLTGRSSKLEGTATGGGEEGRGVLML